LAWVAGMPAPEDVETVTHPSTNRPIVRRPGIEFATIIESQVRRPKH